MYFAIYILYFQDIHVSHLTYDDTVSKQSCFAVDTIL